MPPSADAPGSERVYLPKRPWRPAIIMLLVGIAMIALPELLSPSSFTDARGMVVIAVGCVLIGAAILLIVSAVSNLPRLTVTPRGIRLKTVFGTRWANWDSLSAFAVKTVSIGRAKRRVQSAIADIVGTEVSRNLLGKKTFAIPDGFLTPIGAIVADLNARHTQVPGVAPTFPVETDTAERENRYGIADFRVAWLTLGMLAVLAAVFACEQIFAVDPPGQFMRVGIRTLIALGGSGREITASSGEWYRLLTAPLLHADPAHIALNGIALFMAGTILERLVGRAWLFSLFFIGALGGSLMSLALNPPRMISVGASGAIMAMFAAACAVSFRLPAGTAARSRVQMRSLQVLIPSLLPLAASATTNRIDYGAHLGGALTGAVVGVVLLKTWRDADRLPRFHPLARGITVLGGALFLASVMAVAAHYSAYKAAAMLMPDDQIPAFAAAPPERTAELVARYPKDPRAHMLHGAALARAHDFAGGERELRIALQQAAVLRPLFPPRFDNIVRSLLAAVLQEDGKQSEAKAVARVVCQAPPDEQPGSALLKALFDTHLCQ
jgi:rhomboid protease GluP